MNSDLTARVERLEDELGIQPEPEYPEEVDGQLAREVYNDEWVRVLEGEYGSYYVEHTTRAMGPVVITDDNRLYGVITGVIDDE